MRKKILNIAFIFLAFLCQSFAQKNKALSLENCIDLAIANNPDLKIQDYKTNIAKETYQQSLLEKKPSLSSDFGQSFNLGRNIDPFSNQYVTRPINSAFLGLSSTTILYKGDILRNTSKVYENNIAINKLEIDKLKIELKREVTLAYLEVILKQEFLRLKIEQKRIIESQLKRNTALNAQGNVANAINIDLSASLENENYGIVSLESDLELAKYKLIQSINSPELKSIEIKEPLVPELLNTSNNTSENLIGLPFLRQKQLEIYQADTRILIKQSEKKPFIYLNGNFFSNYSSEASTRFRNLGGSTKQIVEVVPNEFVSYNNTQLPLNRIVTLPNVEEQNFGYFSQLFSNVGLGLKLNVQYPIFDKNYRNTQIQISKIEKMIAQADFKKAELNLSTSLNELKTLSDIYKKKYYQAVKQEKAQKLAFELAQERFEQGMITFMEFNNAKINLETAKSNIIQNKLSNYFYTLIYKYYFETN